jgi:peptidoglycan/xylan/chitin deacetylase (PgdA/CDA1 family)
MPTWKQLLLSLYYYGELPWRAWRNQQAAAAGLAPIIVLAYHRVSNDAANDWTISAADFARHICWLEKHFDFVSLEEAQRRIRSSRNNRPCVSITFDDGYADNLQWAMPMLIAKRIPVTYFVCADATLRGAELPQDVAMGNHLARNTVEQLRALAKAGVSIGAHTRTHADLGAVTDIDRLYDEVVTAGADLQAALDTPIRYFAFPYGGHRNLSARAFHLADEAGYEGVCSAYGGYNFPRDDAFHLQRICVDGPLIRLKNWATVDPWKAWQIHRFFYGPEVASPSTPGVPAR